MNDYLDIYKKFSDIKDIADFVEEVNKLRYYYTSGQFSKMQQHIDSLTKKYVVDTLIWNAVNNQAPTTYQQAYNSAENFLCMEGAKLVAQKVYNFESRLTTEENIYIKQINTLV